MSDTSEKWGNQNGSVVPRFKVKPVQMRVRGKPVIWLISNISFQTFTKGQIVECSGPPLHKAWVSTTNFHAISHGFSEIKYILWEIIRGVPDRNYSIYSKKQSVIQFSWIQLFYVFSRIVCAREKCHIVYIMPCVCTLDIKYAIRFASVMKKDVQLICLIK